MPRLDPYTTPAASEGQPQTDTELRSTLVNRNVTVAGHRTSIRLEPAMWEALTRICERERKNMNEIVTAIARNRDQSTLTAAIRVFLLTYYQAAATDEGHRRAGHGLVTTPGPHLAPSTGRI
jgi:predicted DNA-binding ribbon-helix-helix protein